MKHEDKLTRPPLGLRPAFINDMYRIKEISEAIIRYASTQNAIPIEWIDEYNNLIKKSKKHDEKIN